MHYVSWSYSIYVPKRIIVVVFLFHIIITEFQPQEGNIYTLKKNKTSTECFDGTLGNLVGVVTIYLYLKEMPCI